MTPMDRVLKSYQVVSALCVIVTVSLGAWHQLYLMSGKTRLGGDLAGASTSNL